MSVSSSAWADRRPGTDPVVFISNRSKRPKPVRSSAPVLLLLVLQTGDEHLLGPLGCAKVILEDAVEELHELLVALLLGILDEGLQRLGVIGGLVEHAYEVVVLVLGLPGCLCHLFSFRSGLLAIPRVPRSYVV